MRLLITADLHYNHGRSRALADQLIDEMNAVAADVLLIVGDTAVSEGDHFEAALSRFHFRGPKLVVAGNHEYWSGDGAIASDIERELAARAASIGWRWLEREPFVAGDVAIVGSVGWYDYTFAPADLGVPRRFYERKVSPAVAERLTEHADLMAVTDDISPIARDIIARWNDGKFVRLGMSDESFLESKIEALRDQLVAVRSARRVLCAVHHVPFADLLPGRRSHTWDFARAYLGSGRIGECLLEHPNVSHVVCGHSHAPMEARIGNVRAINVGSGNRYKRYVTVDI